MPTSPPSRLRVAGMLQAQLRELQARQTDRGLVLAPGDVLFDTGKAALMERGIAAQRVIAAGNETAAGRQQNRRVEIIISNPVG